MLGAEHECVSLLGVVAGAVLVAATSDFGVIGDGYIGFGRGVGSNIGNDCGSSGFGGGDTCDQLSSLAVR